MPTCTGNISGFCGRDSMKIRVSVVIPVYNESRFIDTFVQSLLKQTYPREKMEWLFVDGMSTDGTLAQLESFRASYPKLITVLNNPDRTVPYAMNRGILASQGEYIIRLDAHSKFEPNYIERCVHYLDTTDADNVGGRARTKSVGFIGGAIAKMLASKFGVGNSAFRTGGKSGYVDTVPFGAFRREVFDRVGLYDERLTRNQDNELNYRIRSAGGKIYLASDIRFSYFSRDSIQGILSMAQMNGKWNVITMKIMPGSMGIRHFIPLAFVLSLIVLSWISLFFPWVRVLLAVELGAYLLFDVIASAFASTSGKEFILLLVLFPLFHISYGLGSIEGLWEVYVRKTMITNKRENREQNP